MSAFWHHLAADEHGATAIEYGLIAALIAVSAVSVMYALGNEIDTTYETVRDDVSEANQKNQ